MALSKLWLHYCFWWKHLPNTNLLIYWSTSPPTDAYQTYSRWGPLGKNGHNASKSLETCLTFPSFGRKSRKTRHLPSLLSNIDPRQFSSVLDGKSSSKLNSAMIENIVSTTKIKSLGNKGEMLGKHFPGKQRNASWEANLFVQDSSYTRKNSRNYLNLSAASSNPREDFKLNAVLDVWSKR